VGALEGIEDFIIAILMGLITYIVITIYDNLNTLPSFAQVFVLAVLVVLGGVGVKLFLRIYNLLYEEE